MIHTKKIKDHRGIVRICISLFVYDTRPSVYGEWFQYYVSVWHTPKGKRSGTFSPEIATEEEIQTAKIELWEKLKP